MAFSSGEVLTAANLNDLDITSITTTGASTFKADQDITDFTDDTRGIVTLYNSDGAVDDFTCLDFDGNSTDPAARIGMKYTGSGSELHFGTSNSYASGITNDAMIISPTGRVGIGASPNANRQIFVQSGEAGILPYEFHNNRDVASAGVYGGILRIGTDSTSPDTGDYWILIRKGDSTTIGSIRGTGGDSVNFSTTSDQTLKNDLGDAGDVSSIIDDLKIHKFTWKNSPDAGEQLGLFAQEAILVDGMPKGIIAEPATVKEIETNPDTGEEEEVERYLPASLDYGKLVPLLIQEVKSLRQRVATLEA